MWPKFGYFPNSKKTKLLDKPELFLKSQSLFKGTNITVVTEGVAYLGGAIGSGQFIGSVLEKAEKAACGSVIAISARLAISASQTWAFL